MAYMFFEIVLEFLIFGDGEVLLIFIDLVLNGILLLDIGLILLPQSLEYARLDLQLFECLSRHQLDLNEYKIQDAS